MTAPSRRGAREARSRACGSSKRSGIERTDVGVGRLGRVAEHQLQMRVGGEGRAGAPGRRCRCRRLRGPTRRAARAPRPTERCRGAVNRARGEGSDATARGFFQNSAVRLATTRDELRMPSVTIAVLSAPLFLCWISQMTAVGPIRQLSRSDLRSSGPRVPHRRSYMRR